MKGFSLIELLIVVGIIAVLSIIVATRGRRIAQTLERRANSYYQCLEYQAQQTVPMPERCRR